VLRAARRAGFEVGAYDLALPLVVDPEIGYTFGFAEEGKDIQVAGIAVDPTGAAYVAGRFKSAGAGGVLTIDVYLAKLNPQGTALVYSTMLGGADLDQATAIAVDDAGNAYITGSTSSGDYPTTAGAFQTTNPQPSRVDAFVTKIGPDGSTLAYSSYLGGGGVEFAKAIAIDTAGNAYVTGNTESNNFPTTAAAQATYGGGLDAFVTKVNAAGSAKVYSTYLGGSGGDPGSGLAVDAAGNAYVVGETDSSNFPISPGAFQTTRSAPRDAFWAKYDASGQRVASTYVGGSDFDRANAVAIDSAGNSYLTGETQSSDFPLASPVQATIAGNFDLFVTELNPGGTAVLFSTFYGGTQFETGHAIIVDDAGLVYVVGDTYSSDFPTVAPLQPSYGGGISDAMVLQLDPGAAARGAGGVLFASNFGGPRTEFGVGAALSRSGAGAKLSGSGLLYIGSFLPNLSSGGDENEEGEISTVELTSEPQGDLVVSASVKILRKGSRTLYLIVNVSSGLDCDDVKVPDAKLTIEIPANSGVGYSRVVGSAFSIVSNPPVGQPGTVLLSESGEIPTDGYTVLIEMSILDDPPRDDLILFRVIGSTTAFECDDRNNDVFADINLFEQTAAANAKSLIITPAKEALGAPKVQEVVTAGSSVPRIGGAEKTSALVGFNVYTSTRPNVQPVPGNLFTTVDPNHRIADVSGAPAGSFFVVTTVTDSGESPPSNEVGGTLPTVTKLKVSASKIVAQGTGFADDVQVFYAGIPFSTGAKLKKANTKVVQKGTLATGQTTTAFTDQVLGPGSTVVVLFLNGNGNGVAVEYTP
jgi:hypothetical protein